MEKCHGDQRGYQFLCLLSGISVAVYLLLGKGFHLQGAWVSCIKSQCFLQTMISPSQYATFFYPYSFLILALCVCGLLFRGLVSRPKQTTMLLCFTSLAFLGLIVMSVLSWQRHQMPLWTAMHFLFALILLLCIIRMWIYAGDFPVLDTYKLRVLRPYSYFAFFLVVLSVLVSTWMNVQFADLSCPTFPDCNGHYGLLGNWWNDRFFLASAGGGHSSGVLMLAARENLQMISRYVSLMAIFYLSLYSLIIMIAKRFRALRPYGTLLFVLLISYVLFGVLDTVWYQLWTVHLIYLASEVMVFLLVATILYRTK